MLGGKLPPGRQVLPLPTDHPFHNPKSVAIPPVMPHDEGSLGCAGGGISMGRKE